MLIFSFLPKMRPELLQGLTLSLLMVPILRAVDSTAAESETGCLKLEDFL
jgi:hypothetical protein